MADDDLDMLLSSARSARARRDNAEAAEAETAATAADAPTPIVDAGSPSASGDRSIDAVLPRAGTEAHPERRRRWMLGLSIVLAAVAFAGLLTDAVAASQLLSAAGPWSFAIVWPLGGLSLLATASLQSRFVDRFARVPVLVGLLAAYAAAFVLLLVLVGVGVTASVPAALAWLLADQMNFLLPLVVWSLAGDVFTAGEALSVFPRMSRWLYVGQFAGLGVATLAAQVWRNSGSDLLWLLILAPVACAVAALAAPRLLRGATTADGHHRAETSREAARNTAEFLRDLPAFKWLWTGSFAVMFGGTMVEFAFFELNGARTKNAATLQLVYAGVTLLGFVMCWVVQASLGPKLLAKFGVPTALTVLPAAVVLAAGIALTAGLSRSVVVAVVALLVWRLPRWSLDASARQAAMALLPDERRARASFAIDLVPIATALVVSAIPIAVMLATHSRWIATVPALLAGLVGVWLSRRVVSTWETTQLSYRLKRRKRLS
ncbi:MAG: hypothetical protein RLZ14_912 [Actinomycetota bacterium]